MYLLLISLHPLCGRGDLLCFAESASALTRKPLLGLFPNICSMHTSILALRYSVSSTKSKMAAKILRTLVLEPLNRFVSCLI